MANILYLVHRLPYPPNKGDKVRSYHLLKHLVARHNVYLGTFVDDPDDEQHVARLQGMCSDMLAVPLRPLRAKVGSLAGLVRGDPLSLGYYHSAALMAWVVNVAERCAMDAAVVFSSAMAQYVPRDGASFRMPCLVDFVDVDSAKWAQYSEQRAWPMSWVFDREGRTLLAYERAIASMAFRSFFVTEKESDYFRKLAPECANNVQAIGNGVDADFFSPDAGRQNPFCPGETSVVFTGAMDYWPNIDAVAWFASEVLPALLATWPRVRFVVVGRSPPPSIVSLMSAAVTVTGTVADVRPYLQHAAVVVAPMRLARGVQNKILEAMAMARPVVAAVECATAISAKVGHEFLAAAEPLDYVSAIGQLLGDPDLAIAMGKRGRDCVTRNYSWDAQLAKIDDFLPGGDCFESMVRPAGSV